MEISRLAPIILKTKHDRPGRQGGAKLSRAPRPYVGPVPTPKRTPGSGKKSPAPVGFGPAAASLGQTDTKGETHGCRARARPHPAHRRPAREPVPLLDRTRPAEAMVRARTPDHAGGRGGFADRRRQPHR